MKKINQARVSTENTINDNLQQNDPVTSQVESMALKHPEIEGGSGYAAATLGDLGFEPHRELMKIVGFRNVLVHDYLDINDAIVRALVTQRRYAILENVTAAWREALDGLPPSVT